MVKGMIDSSLVSVIDLDKENPISKGGITTKAILETHDTKVIAFLLDSDQEVSEHKSPYPAIVHVWQGKIEFVVEGQIYLLEKNSFLYMPPEARHSLKSIDASKFLLTLLKKKK